MKKLLNIIIIIIFALITIAAFTACSTPETEFPFNNNKQNDNDEGDKITLSTASEAEVTIKGRVRDVYFNPIREAEIFFGMDNDSLAAVSEDNGAYEFNIKGVSNNSNIYRIKDYIGLNNDYNYNTIDISANQETRIIDIVCAPKASDINVFNLITLGVKVSFFESDLPLPKGYISRDNVVTKTIAGETVVRNVEFYVGDYLLGISDQYGFELKAVYPGTIVTVKKKDFTFVTLVPGGSLPLTVPATDTTPEYPESFVVYYPKNTTPFDIRAVIIEGKSIQDVDL